MRAIVEQDGEFYWVEIEVEIDPRDINKKRRGRPPAVTIAKPAKRRPGRPRKVRAEK